MIRQFFTGTFLLFSILYFHRSTGQCPNGLTPGPNMVVNGDFSAGNVDFTSEYVYCSAPNCINDEGMYGVGPDASFYNPAFTGSDHTSGNGNFLIANGAPGTATKVWCQTVAIEPGSYYELRFWVSSLVQGNPAVIQFYIDGVPLLAPIVAPFNTGTWVQYYGTFQSGLLYSTDICLVNTNTGANANDFGIDDITLQKCQCNLSINAGPDQSTCYGGSVQLDGSGSISYFWSPQAGLSCFQCEDPVASPSTTTEYIVSVNGPSGCIALDTVLVTIHPAFDMGAGPDTTICDATTVQLHASGAVTYSWSPAETLSDPEIPDPVASPVEETTYYVSAIDEFGCSQFDSTTVGVFEPVSQPVSVVPADTVICPFQTVYLNAQGADGYEWSPADFLSCIDCEDPAAVPDYSITYVVSALDSNKCSAGSDSAHIEISTNCSYLVIPAAFSPNGDGKNDSFGALSQNVASFDLKIFNRWGEMVFSTTSADTTWDGSYNGADQPVGVYVWRLEASLTDGTPIIRNGNVTLVR